MRIWIDPDEFLDAVRPALQAGDPCALANVVNERWHPHQLCLLLSHHDADVRRVAAVSIGLVGDVDNASCLYNALHDEDEQVNQMAEHGLWTIWFRNGSEAAHPPFHRGVKLLALEKYNEALSCFKRAIENDPTFAEAYNQCAIAHFFLGQWDQAIRECKRTISLIPEHFGAISGMGHCYASLGDLCKALRCYKQALKINPNMPAIAKAIDRLEHIRDTQNDASGEFFFDEVTV